ncbi:DUF3073 domain-containing protein [Leifsonia virtsii]|uniref:DUF3073 domain-containing protein n=1 Tax=Leifsonia virtsii TaxID=3035915 RepID=A0ABT8IW03_9MICO|nr:DUF3073 domain-containing protein [Leifsonia virtsii]MDN4596991.1 DUF3073 domain-containing protein [Leifsonia virtsii]
MGRGRQKAKHTKIARQLKSFSPNVNYDALERELTSHSHDEDDQYAKWADYEPEDANESDDEYDYADEDEETGTPKRA